MDAAAELELGHDQPTTHLEAVSEVSAELPTAAEIHSPLVLDTRLTPDVNEIETYVHEDHSSYRVLLKVMEAVGVVDPEIDEEKKDEKETDETSEVDEVTVDEAEISLQSLQKIRTIPRDKAKESIQEAIIVYEEEYRKANGRIDGDKLEVLIDQTQYPESSLLSILQRLRARNLPNTDYERTVVKAERIARIMILKAQGPSYQQ